MARNDHEKSPGGDSRSMEEKLASLDALSNEPLPDGEPSVDEPAGSEPPGSQPDVTTDLSASDNLPPNPWMQHDPPSEQAPPPSYGTPQAKEPPFGGPPQAAPDFGIHQPPQPFAPAPPPASGFGSAQTNGAGPPGQASPYGSPPQPGTGQAPPPPLEPLPGSKEGDAPPQPGQPVEDPLQTRPVYKPFQGNPTQFDMPTSQDRPASEPGNPYASPGPGQHYQQPPGTAFGQPPATDGEQGQPQPSWYGNAWYERQGQPAAPATGQDGGFGQTAQDFGQPGQAWGQQYGNTAPPAEPTMPQDTRPAQQQPGPYSQPAYGAGEAYGQQPGAYGQQPGPQGLAPLPGTEERPPHQTAESLSPETLLRGRRQSPSGGWRKAVYRASAGLITPGESPTELRRRELVARASTAVATGHHRVAVMSLKGGVGKTTSTVGLGATLASLRGDRVIAVDANPDRGTLSDKVRLETAATVRDLLNERDQIQRYADVRSFTSQSSSRLEVLASDRDPAVSEAFSAVDYQAVAEVLEHFYSICLTDCGTGLLHSAMSGVLGMANQIVLVSSPSVDGARSASATLDWLEAHSYGDLVRNAVVVLSAVRPRSKSTIDLDRLEHHFATRSRAVVRIPYDPHLEEGAEVELDQLSAATQDAYLVLAATVGDGFAWPR